MNKINWFKFHIGDYIAHTAHLSLMEDLAYRRLISAYYLNERQLKGSAKEISRLILMRDNVADVEQVLNEFFTPNSSHNKWTNKRCDKEIKNYKNKIKKTSEAGRLSGVARKKANKIIDYKPNKSLTSVHQMLNKPRTKNQEPRTNKKIDTEFDIFWKNYPNKTGKKIALLSWKKHKPSLQAVLKALSWQKKSDKWQADNGQYIPNPATYINQGRWEDELSQQINKSVAKKISWWETEEATLQKAMEIGYHFSKDKSLGEIREGIQQRLSGVNYVR